MKTSRRSSLNYAAIAAGGAPSGCGRLRDECSGKSKKVTGLRRSVADC
jgi:hypothetical protein